MKIRAALLPLVLTSGVAIGVLTGPAPLAGQGVADRGPAATLLDAAERRARNGDLAGALTDYELLLERFPESPQAPEAMLRIARGRRSVGDRAAAFVAIERLIAAHPGAPQAAAGLVLEGRMRSELPGAVEELRSARKTLEKVWLLFPPADYPGLSARSAARVLDGEIALRLRLDGEAATAFVEVLEMEPVTPRTAAAHIGFGTALIRGGEWEAAAESLQDALGVPDAAAETTALARRRMELLQRRFLRPATGAKLWERARRVVVSGAEPKRLTGVAADDRGRLLVVDSGADRLLALSADGAVEKSWPVRKGEKPSWGRDGRPQVAVDDVVLLPDEGSEQFGSADRARALDGILAVEWGPFGQWIVLASRSSGVLSYPAQRGDGRRLLGGGGDPVDLASDGDRVYALEKRGRRLVRIVPDDDGAGGTVVNGGWRQAKAVTVDPFGFFHVLDGGEGRVHTYDASGAEVGVVGPILPGGIALRRAEDLAAAGDGRLFIVDAREGLIVLE